MIGRHEMMLALKRWLKRFGHSERALVVIPGRFLGCVGVRGWTTPREEWDRVAYLHADYLQTTDADDHPWAVAVGCVQALDEVRREVPRHWGLLAAWQRPDAVISFRWHRSPAAPAGAPTPTPLFGGAA